jgi:hypothetical protein
MIPELLIGSVTAITCCSFWLADRVLKMQKEEREALDRPTPVPPPPLPPPVIYPYRAHRHRVSGCPLCGTLYENAYVAQKGQWVPTMTWPEYCEDRSCRAVEHVHTHISCRACGGLWYMKPQELSSEEARKAAGMANAASGSGGNGGAP